MFIHGALCISYSGQCLLSSMIGGRSGNRGLCAQPCRLPFELIEKDINNQKIVQNILHSHYKNKINFYKKIDKFDDYYRICLLILGIIAILLSENFVSFLSELFLIAGWVVIWEIVYDVIFNEIRRKRKENIYKKLANSDIIFVDK